MPRLPSPGIATSIDAQPSYSSPADGGFFLPHHRFEILETDQEQIEDIVSAPTTRPPEQSETAPNGTTCRARRGQARFGSGPKRIAPHQLTGAQAVIRSLEELDVDIIFGIPGGAVLPVYDPLFDSKKLRHVLVRHEQGAGHAASGYAHATGKVGCAWRPRVRAPRTW